MIFSSNGTQIGTATLVAGVATLSNYTFTTAGTFSITASFAAQGNYGASNSTTQSLTVFVPIATTTTVAPAPNPVAAGVPVFLKATVASTSGTPTGTVSFTANGSSIGTAQTLSGGTASIPYTFGSVASEAIVAAYTPIGTFTASTGTATLVVEAPVTAAAGATTPSSISPGSSATSTLTITPQGGFTGSLAANCSSPVPWITCSVSTPASITSTAPSSATITINVAATVGNASMPSRPGTSHKGIALAWFLPFTALLLVPYAMRRKSALRLLAILLLSAGVSVGMTACGGSSSNNGSSGSAPPAGTQNLTITTSANGVVVPTTLSINII